MGSEKKSPQGVHRNPKGEKLNSLGTVAGLENEAIVPDNNSVLGNEN